MQQRPIPVPAALALVLLVPAALVGGCPGGGPPTRQDALVVYNTNHADALPIALHYAVRRGVAASHLCPVELPVGSFASQDHLLAARRTIVEDCLCALLPESTRPDPCDVSAANQIRQQSQVTHLALVKGIPPRLYGTGWPSDFEEPSFDFYLSYLIYRREDIFAPGSLGIAISSYLTSELIAQGDELMILSAPPLDPAVHRDVAYGRIEAMDLERTLDLIDRTVEAERLGIAGNVLDESAGGGFDFLRHLTGSYDPACTDYITHEPFLFDTPESSWPHATCRAGTTHVSAAGPNPGSSSDDPSSEVVPGSFMSVVPRAVDVALMLGSTPWVNQQSGFNSFDVLTNWRKTDQPCTPLCVDLPSQAERDACVAASSDYFAELDTDCVGAGRGLIGHQVRSYPVQYYGFLPPGWTTSSNGAVERTPGSIRSGGAYQDARFTDDLYLHLGVHSVDDPDENQCTLEDGSVEPCRERIAVSLTRRIDPPVPLPVVGTREFAARVRHRNPANPGGSLRLRLALWDGAAYLSKAANVPLGAASPDWRTSEAVFSIDESELAQLTRLDLEFGTRLSDQLYGFLDLDGVELVDLETGDSILDAEAGSFAAPAQDVTHPGDWAANAIDRLGAIAWWGSSSHHITGGWAFSAPERFYGAFFMGRTLGESLLLSGKPESGIIYGDPLYRPVAVRIHIPGQNHYGAAPGLLVHAAELGELGTVFLNVLHGTDHARTVRWSLSSCPILDPVLCNDSSLWTEELSGSGALEDHPVGWTDFINPALPQDLLLRLRVWNPGEESEELFNYAYFSYSP